MAFINREKKWLLATARESGFRQVGRKSVVIITEHYNMKKSGAVRYTMLENSSIALLSVTPRKQSIILKMMILIMILYQPPFKTSI